MATVIGFSVLYLSVCLFSDTFFLILLQYNIWSHTVNYNVCDANFSLRVKLRRHIQYGHLKLAPAILICLVNMTLT